MSACSSADVDAVIDNKAQFMECLTANVLLLLSHGRSKFEHRSLILNISSQRTAGIAAKAFSDGFKVGLARVVEDYRSEDHVDYVDCLAVILDDVPAQGNPKGVTATATRAEYLGKRAVLSVDAAVKQRLRTVYPYWRHDLERRLMDWIGDDGLKRKAVGVIRKLMDLVSAWTFGV